MTRLFRTVLAILLMAVAAVNALALAQRAYVAKLTKLQAAAKSLRSQAGVTLVELMVAAAVLSVGILGLVGSFGLIQRSIQSSKNKTLAANLAQEKMQILKQKNYYQVLISTDPAYRTDYSPSIPYDAGYFPPEHVLEGGVRFTRLTYVQVAREDSGVVVTLPPGTPDTGMKLITITVLWSQGKDKLKLELRSVFSNTDTSMANCIFNGTVRNASTMAPINAALVNIAENVGWRDTADGSGQYTVSLNPGSYSMVASARGYFTEVRTVSIAPNQTLTQDFNLSPMSSGTVRGTVWYNDHLVLSQVVGSTVSAEGYSQEYVAVFNPTTYTWTVGGDIGLRFQRASDASKKTIAIDYIAPTIAPGGFYLFANTATVTAAGASVAADAVWTATNSVVDFPYFSTQSNIIPTSNQAGEGGGALELYRISDGAVLDRMGWDRNNGSQSAPFAETTGLDENVGLEQEEQYVRYSSTAGVNAAFGPAYDSGNNDVDWDRNSPISIPPRGTASGTLTVISGVPAKDAIVSCTDGLSTSTSAVLTGSPPRADFSLTQVATGTWTVYIASGSYLLQNGSVTIAGSGSVYSFPSDTTILTESNAFGFVSGIVTDALGAPISPAVTVSPGAAGADGSANVSTGRYLLQVLPGLIDVTANPNAANASYVSQSSQALTVSLGAVKSGVDFRLSQGGRISGFVTRDGINPLPGVAVAAFDSNGVARDQQVSDLNGRFTTVNLTTGTYSVEPALGSHESSTPGSQSVNVTIGATVFSTTFTISGAMGSIEGTVQSAGAPIGTGVLIVVTTITLSGAPPAPPALSTATLLGPPYYVGSSYEDGTYSVEVRQSTSPAYRVYAYYTTLGPSGAVTINSQVLTNVQVLAGQTVSGKNFSW